MQKTLTIILSIIWTTCAFGQVTTGYHRVNQLLQRGTSGAYAQIVPRGTIHVTSTATGLLATIYRDPLLTSQIASGSVTSDANGNYDYYIPLNYCVDETVSSPGAGSYTTTNICGNTGSSVALFATPPVLGSTTPNVVNGTSASFSGTLVAGVSVSAQTNITYTPTTSAELAADLALGSNITINLPCGTWTLTARSLSSTNMHLHGAGRDCAFIQFSNTDGITFTGSNVEVDGITFEGTTGRFTVQAYGVSQFRFHDNTITQAGTQVGVGSGYSGALIIGNGSSDLWVERNIFTANGVGPTGGTNPQGYDVWTNYDNKFTTRLHLRNNRVFSSNTGISFGLYNCTECDAENNVIDQNDMYNSAEGTGQGYGIMYYEISGTDMLSSISRTSNVVTAILPSAPSFTFTSGMQVLVTQSQFGPNGTDFNGVFTLTGVTGTTFTWAQTAPDDSISSPNASLKHAIFSPQIIGNIITNTAGGCIYLQGAVTPTVEHNTLSQCDQNLSASSLPQSCIGLAAVWGGTITGNVCSGNPISDGVSLAGVYSTSITGNTFENLTGDYGNGINLKGAEHINVTGNTIRNAGYSGIGDTGTSVSNCYKCTFGNNDIWMSPTGLGYYFQGYDADINITGGSVYAPSSTGSNSGIYFGVNTNNVNVTGVSIDGYGDGSTVSEMNFGIIALGANSSFTANKIKGVSLYGISDRGTDQIFRANTITNSGTGILTVGTRPQIVDNVLWSGVTTPINSGSATNPYLSGNQTASSTPPNVLFSNYTNANGTVIPSTALGNQGPATGYVQLAPSATGTPGCLYDNGSGIRSWAACSGMTWPTQTNYYPLYAGSSAWGTSHIDDGVTTVSTITSTETIAAPGYKGTGSGTATIQLPVVSYSTLNAAYPCSSTYTGMRASVNDAPTDTWGAAISPGGGGYTEPAFCNGSAWVVK